MDLYLDVYGPEARIEGGLMIRIETHLDIPLATQCILDAFVRYIPSNMISDYNSRVIYIADMDSVLTVIFP